MTRPRIALLGRFTESASALRYRGVVSSRALVELIWAAGGDPVTLLPGAEPDAVDWAATSWTRAGSASTVSTRRSGTCCAAR